MPKMQKIRNLFLLVGRDEQFMQGGDISRKSKKYMNKNIRCNISIVG